MKKSLPFAVGTLLIGLYSPSVSAQGAPSQVVVVPSCGGLNLQPTGPAQPLYMDHTGLLCTGAQFSGSITVGTVTQGPAGSASSGWYVQPGTGVTFPISAAALPLPTGAATNATLQSILTALGSPFQAGGVIGNTSFFSKTQDGAGNNITSDVRGSARPLAVEILDQSGNQITTFGGAGGTASNFGAAFPTPGTAIGVKNGANMVNLTADGSNNLNINCAVGCVGGTSGNNADSVAAISTGAGQTQSYPYLWNGTNFDRLYGDKTNGAWVNVKTSVLPTGSATAALQTTGNNTLTTINTTLGNPFQANGAISNASFGAKLQDGVGNAITSDARGSSRPIATEIVDANGNQVVASSLKAANTQAVAGDTSTVIQINPNQPNFTTPLNVQTNPKTATTTQTGSSVGTQNAFQTALAANSSRLGATVQNTSTGDIEYIFFGANVSATKPASFQIQPGGTISAVTGTGVVITDNISITCADATPANCTYVVAAQ